MARTDVVARRYAEALFSVARERGSDEKQRKALERALQLLGAREVAAALANPRVRPADRERLALALLEDATPEVRNLVRLLLRRGRVAILAGVLEAYTTITDRARGVVRAEVTAAIPVDDALRRRTATTLSQVLGREVETTVRQDPDVIGGLVIRIGDRVIDGSIRTRLARLRAALS